MRVFLTLLAVASAAFVFTGAAPAPIIPSDPIPDCDDPGASTPCFVSITKNGTTTLHQNDVLETGVEVIGGQTFVIEGARHWNFSIQDEHGDFNLNTADTYEVVLDIGNGDPGETFSRGQNVVIDRDTSVAGHHTVTFTMSPVPVSYTLSGCNGNGTCPTRPDVEATGYLEGSVDNLNYITDPADEAAMQGWDLVASTDWISSPPTLDYDTHTFIIDAANSHCANLGPDPCASAGPIGLVHFDTHTDTGTEVFGVELSHGTPMYRLVEEGLVDPARYVQIGLRGYWPGDKEFSWQRERGIRSFFMTIDRAKPVLGAFPVAVTM